MSGGLLRKSAREFGLDLTDEQLERCEFLVRELQRWNRRINLTAIVKTEQILIKHILDSLSLVPLIAQGLKLLDIGSGAGFPALPLALIRPDLRITSIDAVGKKVSFQRHIKRLMQLDNLEAVHGRVEELAHKRDVAFDVVTSRAFSDLSLFTGLAKPLLCQQGLLIAMRGVDDNQEQDAILVNAGFVLERVVKYVLPLEMGSRSLLLARKTL